MFAEHPLLSVTTNQCLPTPVSPLPLISAVRVCPPPPHSRLLCILWAVVGGTHGEKKKQSTHLQACSRRFFFFFFALHDRGRKWNTGMGGKKSGLAFLFFLLMMLLCTIVASTCCLFPAVCCSLNLAAVILAYFCGHGCSQALRCNYHCCRVEKGGGIFPEHFLFIHFLFFCVAPCAAV